MKVVRKEDSSLRRLSLVALISEIVREDNRDALREFHERRPVFCFRTQHSLLLIEFVERLRQALTRTEDGRFADDAYELTVDKFSRLPNEDAQCPGNGPDCRWYFRPVLAGMEEPPGGTASLEQEQLAARALQGLVWRHFHLSLLEVRRRGASGRTRYVWSLPGGSISVMMPAGITGRTRRTWLAQHVNSPDPRRPGEQQRIQAIVNEVTGPVYSSFDDAVKYEVDVTQVHNDVKWTDGSALVRDLAKTVAQEKAERIAEQRPSIRAMGAEALRDMILRLFAALTSEDFSDGDIAREFCIGKVAFSRFAGTSWHARQSIPDLWANTAHVLAGNPAFTEMARDSGVWDRVSQVLKGDPRPTRGRVNR